MVRGEGSVASSSGRGSSVSVTVLVHVGFVWLYSLI